MNAKSEPSEELARIIESAKRLGVELNEGEALQWLAAGPALAPAWMYVSLANALVNLGILVVWTRRALQMPESVAA